MLLGQRGLFFMLDLASSDALRTLDEAVTYA